MSKIDFSDEYFMRQALREARAAYDKDEVPIGVVIVSKNLIVAKSHNLTEILKDVTAHAEILAIGSATETLGGKYLNSCTMYVTLEPCVMCAGALAWAQLDKLVIGANDDKRGFSKYKPSPLHPKTKVVTGILSDECGELIKRFFESKRGNDSTM